VLLGVRFRAPARRPAPGGGRGLRLVRAAASKRLQAAPRQRTPAPPKTAEIIPHPTRRTAHATAAHARAAHRATAPSNRTSSRVCHRAGSDVESDAPPPRAPPAHARPGYRAGAPRRLPGPHRRGGCGARLWGVWAVRDSVCVSPRRGERPRPRARYAAAPRRSPLHV